MIQTKWWKAVIVTATLAVAVMGVRQFAQAQQDQNPSGPGGGAGGFASRMGGFPGGGFGGGTQIAVSGSNVFLVRGNMIYRLDADTLEIKAKAELPAVATTNARGTAGAAGGARFRSGGQGQDNGGTPPPPAGDAGGAPAGGQ